MLIFDISHLQELKLKLHVQLEHSILTLASRLSQNVDHAQPGKYCREKSVTETGPCDAGFYCPTNITNGVSSLRIGSFGPNQVPCPKASFRNETGARTEADCYACPVGYYCPEGTVNPIICPLGYYCPPDSGDPQPCPVGHFNNRSGIHFVENCTACTPGWWVNGRMNEWMNE